MAGEDWAGAVGEGLSSFMAAYKDERKRQDDEKDKDKRDSFNQLIAGVRLNPNGQYEYTPEKQQEMTLGKLKTQNEAQGYQPDTPYAGFLKNIAVQQIKSAHPEYSDEQIKGMVPEHLNAEQYKTGTGLTKTDLTGFYGMEGRKAIAGAMQGRNDIAREGLNLRKDQVGYHVGQDILNDPVVKSADLSNVALAKGIERLKTAKEINPQMFREIQSDMASALQGGRMTEGGNHRTQMELLDTKLADIEQNYLSKVKDVGAPQAKLYLLQNMQGLASFINTMKKDRIMFKKKNATAAFPTNGAVDRVTTGLIGDNEFNPSGQVQGQGIMSNLSPEDQAAIATAQRRLQKNPKDADALAVMKMHGF